MYKFSTSVLCVFIISLISCSSVPEKNSFITTLGQDTLVIEQFTMQPTEVNAELLIRTPETQLFRQQLLLDENGGLREFTSERFDPDNPGGPSLESRKISIDGDSLLISISGKDGQRENRIANEPSLLPWIDMVHWPYEVAIRYMIKNGSTSVDQLMLAGRGAAIFEIRRISDGSVSIKHPYRGTMTAEIDDHGAILTYDASETTRKLKVIRGGEIDINALAGRYANKPIGSLSGAATSETTVHGAKIIITHGQPAKRGRELFGGIVAWDEVWRTGANRATHFSTDQPLLFGELAVEPGEYTLFTIPAPDGGMLIINRQTGQNGNNYDSAQDLGRVPMTLRSGADDVELFTITTEEADGTEGLLLLKWGNSVFEIPFTVADNTLL